jgi:hypothetical protein
VPIRDHSVYRAAALTATFVKKATSALGQIEKSRRTTRKSASPPTPDIGNAGWHVSKVRQKRTSSKAKGCRAAVLAKKSRRRTCKGHANSRTVSDRDSACSNEPQNLSAAV